MNYLNFNVSSENYASGSLEFLLNALILKLNINFDIRSSSTTSTNLNVIINQIVLTEKDNNRLQLI